MEDENLDALERHVGDLLLNDFVPFVQSLGRLELKERRAFLYVLVTRVRTALGELQAATQAIATPT